MSDPIFEVAARATYAATYRIRAISRVEAEGAAVERLDREITAGDLPGVIVVVEANEASKAYSITATIVQTYTTELEVEADNEQDAYDEARERLRHGDPSDWELVSESCELEGDDDE